jgi:hypothetical protein
MNGALSPSIIAQALMIMGWKCLVFLAPFFVVAVVWWLINRTDRVIGYLYPDLEWEHSLGWLNIQAERRANTAIRWLGYGIYVILFDALVGILWAAEGLQNWDRWSDPWVMGDLALRVPALLICMGIWILYLGGWLIPKLRIQREEAELKRFRAELGEGELERGKYPRSRVQQQPMPRKNPAMMLQVRPAITGPNRMRRRGLPGE